MKNHTMTTHHRDDLDLREEEKNREEIETSGHEQTDVGYQCRLCDKKFRKSTKLRNHISRVHKGDRELQDDNERSDNYRRSGMKMNINGVEKIPDLTEEDLAVAEDKAITVDYLKKREKRVIKNNIPSRQIMEEEKLQDRSEQKWESKKQVSRSRIRLG